MKPDIGIKSENLKAVCDALNISLADLHVLYIKTRHAHWNVEGPDFHAQHIFFEEQYRQLADIIDQVAERIRSLGQPAAATMGDFLKLTRLNEKSRKTNDSQGFIKELLEDHEGIIKYLRDLIDPFADKYGDAGTSDFVTGIMEMHEKMAWMLRAHLA